MTDEQLRQLAEEMLDDFKCMCMEQDGRLTGEPVELLLAGLKKAVAAERETKAKSVKHPMPLEDPRKCERRLLEN